MGINEFIEDSSMQWKKLRSKLATVGSVLLVIFGWLVYFVVLAGGNNTESAIKNAVETDGKVLPENEGKLVLVSGRVTAEGSTVIDPVFDVTAQSPYMKRYVLQYQEERDREGHRSWDWNLKKFEDDYFKKTIETSEFYSTAKIGEYELSPEQLTKLHDFENTPIVQVTDLKENIANRYYRVVRNRIYNYYLPRNNNSFQELLANLNGEDFGTAGKAEVGDIRIWFAMIDMSEPVECTVLAKQEGSKLTVYSAGNGRDDDIYYVYEGRKSLSEILSTVEAGNKEHNTYVIFFPVIFTVIAIFRIWLKMRRKRR